jgi:adenylate kinase family enzyme
MKKIVILGRGGAGKSTVARQLGQKLDIPVIELDKYFWQPGLVPLSHQEWISVQQKLVRGEKWIMDGDLGVYDALSERLKHADTVIVLNFSFWTCFTRAVRRSKERLDFWWWLFTWRLIELPKVMKTIREHAPGATIIVLKNQKGLDKLVSEVA